MDGGCEAMATDVENQGGAQEAAAKTVPRVQSGRGCLHCRLHCRTACQPPARRKRRERIGKARNASPRLALPWMQMQVEDATYCDFARLSASALFAGCRCTLQKHPRQPMARGS